MSGLCLDYVRGMSGLCLRYVWIMSALCRGYVTYTDTPTYHAYQGTTWSVRDLAPPIPLYHGTERHTNQGGILRFSLMSPSSRVGGTDLYLAISTRLREDKHSRQPGIFT